MSATLVNGTSIAWENIEVRFGSLGVINGITKIDYKREGKHTANYGAGSEPISYGFGQYTYTASMEIYQEEWKKLWLFAGGSPLSLSPQDMYITIAPSQDSVIFPYTDTLYNVKFLDDGMNANSGDTKLLFTINMMISGFDRFS